MSFLKSIGNALGLGGEAGTVTNRTVDPNFGKEYFDQAASTLRGGMSKEDPQQAALRAAINNSAQARLQSMQGDNNAMKSQFMKDQANAFGANQQATARAKGGTGGMAQAFSGGNQGQLLDQQADSMNRGLLGLQQQQGQELANISNIGGQTFGQDFNNRNQQFGQAEELSRLYAGELANRRGLETGNNQVKNQAAAENMKRGKDTVMTGLKFAANVAAPHTALSQGFGG